MKFAKSLAVAGAVMIAAALSSCGRQAGGPQFVLNMSTQQSETAPIVAGFRDWADAVYERTNGNFQIVIHLSASLGSDEDVIEMALMGANVAVLTDGGRMANYVSDIGIIGMPFIAADFEELTRITQTPTFQSWDAQLVNQGVRILSYNWYDGPRNFFTNAPINSPADLSGVRIRTPGAPVWARSVASLGATPIAMPWPDSYNAMQTGVIDGVEVQSTSAYPSRIFEVAGVMTRTEHFHLANFIMVGEAWFQTLPAEYQRILIEECVRASIANAQEILAWSAEFENRMAAQGLQINEVDRAPFIAAAEAAFHELGFYELRQTIWREIGRIQ